MNRRNFLRTLFIAAAAPAIVARAVVAKPVQYLKYPWFQTTRVNAYHSQAYIDALTDIMTRNKIKGVYSDYFAKFYGGQSVNGCT